MKYKIRKSLHLLLALCIYALPVAAHAQNPDLFDRQQTAPPTELEELLSARQAAVSQQLSRLRLEGLVTPRREGKAIYYALTDDRPRKIMEVVYDLFCREE